MKKKFTKIFTSILLLLFFGSIKINAQVNAYSFTSSAGTFTTITGGTTLGVPTNDDTNFPNIPLGFTFNFNGTNYSTVAVNTNGFLAMGNTVSSSYTAISSGVSNNIVSALNRDIQGLSSTGSLKYLTTGSAPNRVFTVQWLNYRNFAGATGAQIYNFQIKLNETTNVIEVVYGVNNLTAGNYTFQVGLRGLSHIDFNNRTTTTNWSAATAGGSNASTCNMNFNGAVYPDTGLTYTWNPPPPCTGTPSAGTVTAPAGACDSTAFTIACTGFSNNASLLSFNWQSDVGCTNNWTDVAGQNFPSTGTFTQTTTTCYRLHVVCVPSGLDAISNTVTVGMNAPIDCYPLWSATSTADEEIVNTTITGVTTLNQTSTCGTLAPGAGSVAYEYSNFRGFSTIPDLMQTSSVGFSLTQQTCGGMYQNGFKIWIDFNQDGDFADAGEGVYSSPTQATGNNTQAGSFIIPYNAALGNTGLRVVCVEANFPNTVAYGATVGYVWGETEDYLCNIIPLIPCSGVPSAGSISQSTSALADTTTVFTLSTVLPPTYAGGIIYQWQINDGNGWQNLGPTINNPMLSCGTPNADTTTVTGQTFAAQYRLLVTCTNSSLTDSSSAVWVFSGQLSPCTSTITYTYTGASNGIQFNSNTLGNSAFYQWDFGDGNFSTMQNPQHNYSSTGNFNVCVIVTDTSFQCSDTVCIAIVIQAQSEVIGTVYHDLNNNNMIDMNESGFSAINVVVNGSQFSTVTDSSGQYSLFLPAGNYFIQSVAPQYYFQTVPMNFSGYNVALAINDTQSGFDFALATNIAFLSGNVYYDLNQNGVKDSGEIGLFNQTVSLDNANWNFVVTDSLGNYSVVVPPGIHELSFENNFYQQNGWTVTNAGGNSITVNADSLGFDYGNNDFGIYIDSLYHDIGVDLYCGGFSPNPGFWSNVFVEYTNYGFVGDSIVLTFHYDSLLIYDNTSWWSFQPDLIDTVNHVLKYFLSSLPGDNDDLDLNFYVPIGTPLGTPINNYVTISSLINGPDDDSSNNTSVCQSVVVGSFDPNEKIVNPAGVGPLHAVPPTETTDLTYTVNFQNTGTAPAVNVVVVDTLDNDAFVISSLHMINTTHPANIELVEGRILRVHFENIMLADSFNNEPESHGSFTFKIHLQNNLPLGTVIANRAAIYFDFNSPVITNDAFVTLANIETSAPIVLSNNFSFYPNPVHDQFFVSLNEKKKCSGKIEVTNTLGQIVFDENFIEKSSLVIDVEKFPAGIYFLTVTSAAQRNTIKFVKD